MSESTNTFILRLITLPLTCTYAHTHFFLRRSPSSLLALPKSPSFRISSSIVTFEDPASLHKKVTVKEATMSAAPCAGANILADGSRTGTWSKYYPLGYIERSPDAIPITRNDKEQAEVSRPPYALLILLQCTHPLGRH